MKALTGFISLLVILFALGLALGERTVARTEPKPVKAVACAKPIPRTFVAPGAGV